MTYLQILNLIKNTALAQPNVNTVVREFIDLNREDTVYSAVVIQDRDGTRDRIVENDYITYTWHLGYVDRLTYDESNRDDIFSTGINVINNIVNSIRNTYFPTLEVRVIDRFNTFNQRFTASCAGVYVVLAIDVQVSDCVDGEMTDMYDSFETKIIENGHYHFIPDGRPVDEIEITVDVEAPKPEESLVETITTNGVHNFTPSTGSVFSDASITVDVQEKEELVLKEEIYWSDVVQTYTYNPPAGKVYKSVEISSYPGNGFFLTRDITENGPYEFYPIQGEDYYTGVSLNVSVPMPREETLVATLTVNGQEEHYTAPSGTLYKYVEVDANIPTETLTETITSNGSYHYDPSEEDTLINGVDLSVDVHPSQSLVETITSNGTTRFSGEWKDAAITVAVSQAKPEETLSETITSNGSYSYSPTPGSVFSSVAISVNCPGPKPEMTGSWTFDTNGSGTLNPMTGYVFDAVDYVVDVHPSSSLVETITSNGTTSFSGEWTNATISVDVHPSNTLSRTYTANGTKTITGEFNGGTINVNVHPSQSLVENITSNGSYNISGEFNGGTINVQVPDGSLPEPDDDEIYYITYTGSPLQSIYFADFDVNVVSNTYDATRNICILKFDGTLTRIGDAAFEYKPQLKKMRLPDTVTEIGVRSFWQSGLIEIRMDGVTSIQEAAFGDCYALISNMCIPDGCLTIGNLAYQHCTGAHTVVIPSSVISIGSGAFVDDYPLQVVYVNATVPPTMIMDQQYGYNQFSNTSGNLTILVPANSLQNYLVAPGWSDYASRIVSQ